MGAQGIVTVKNFSDAGANTKIIDDWQQAKLPRLTLGGSLDLKAVAAPAGILGFGRLYVRPVDANNDGLFIRLKKGGEIVEKRIDPRPAPAVSRHHRGQ